MQDIQEKIKQHDVEIQNLKESYNTISTELVLQAKDIAQLNRTICSLDDTMKELIQKLENVSIGQATNRVTMLSNEKMIWCVVGGIIGIAIKFLFT